MQTSKKYKDNLKNYPKLSKNQLDELNGIEKDAIARFTGFIGELEAAIGMLRIGHSVGWRVLYMIHNKRTIKKYEEILNIDVKEYFDETGPLAHKSFVHEVYEQAGKFWDIVNGRIKVEKRKELK